MSAIARYSERRHEGRRDFTLLPDRIEIKGKEYLGADYETTVLLKTLAPEIDRMRTRSKTFTAGLWLFLVPAIVAFILVQGFAQPALSGVSSMLLALAFCGAFVILATLKKEAYAVFKSTSGVATLSIAKEGNERERFDDFVVAVQRQIMSIRNSEPGAAPNGGPATQSGNSGVTEGPPSVS